MLLVKIKGKKKKNYYFKAEPGVMAKAILFAHV